MQFLISWLVATFVVFLVRYFPTPTVIDPNFIIVTFGWGLLWAVIVNTIVVVLALIVAALVNK